MRGGRNVLLHPGQLEAAQVQKHMYEVVWRHNTQEEEETKTEQQLRKEFKEQLHTNMDSKLKDKHHRIVWAKERKNSIEIWKLIAAAIETV